jgi:hypothetical protein
MELVLVDLDAGAELDATECVEVISAKLFGGTDLGSGHVIFACNIYLF